MHGPSTTKLIVVGTSLTAAVALMCVGITYDYIQPVVFFGTALLALPFIFGAFSQLIDRLRSGPFIVPSMPNTPAREPEIPVAPSKRSRERSAKEFASRRRYPVWTRMRPY